jgi:hypothetical protein
MSVDQQAETDRNLTDAERAAKLQALMASEPLPVIQRSIDAFRGALPELLKTHAGKWVAYRSDALLGAGSTQTELFQLGFRLGLTRNDFIVAFVEPGAFDPNEEFAVTDWNV